MSINGPQIHVQYHKKSCTLLIGNLFQFISKLPIIYVSIDDHQCNPHPCSISQKICIILLGKIFQLIHEPPSIDMNLAEHQCIPHSCSISQKKLYFTPWKVIPNDF